MTRNISFLILFFMVAGVLSAQNQKVYVYAPSGLNMRKTADPASAKVKTIEFGTELTVKSSATSKEMTVDHLSGGMAQVSTGSQDGYMFDGYLCQFRPAEKEGDTRAYVELLRDDGHDVLYEHHEYDYGGYFRDEEGITLLTSSWQEAFLVAKHLYKIPAGIHFPADDQSVVKNPDKKEHVWSDEMNVGRAKDGKIIEMNYFWRAEGGGWSVTFKRSEEMNGILIMYAAIAD